MGALPSPHGRQDTLAIAEVEWWAAIAAVTQLLAELPRSVGQGNLGSSPEGTVISGPLPILTEPTLTQRFATWVLTPQPLANALMGQRSLSPAAHLGGAAPTLSIQVLPLKASEPLLREQFCLVLTATFSGVLVLGQPTGAPWQFQYSFDPDILVQAWERLRASILPGSDRTLRQLEGQLAQLADVRPDYRWITRFSQLLMTHLPHRAIPEIAIPKPDNLRWVNWSPHRPPSSSRTVASADGQSTDDPLADAAPCEGLGLDAELLQAIAHEIRTPLTTIRTLTRSLLRRSNLDAKATQRLQRIDQECTQQIERFNLIFRAAELTGASRHPLAAPLPHIALAQVFEAAIPQWQQQAHRRNLSLDVRLPPNLPRVTSDPTLLSQVLTGVVEWFTQGLPAQSHIQMGVVLAGSQLKLQFKARLEENDGLSTGHDSSRAQLKSLGQLLTVAPDTGGVSLNLDVTKTLFAALGAKLTVRQRPQQGETLTVFLPLETREV
ncbi:MAG: HAMP domain-containing sensor histidine kinase [Cyanobacteria bacterium]|nr:HAMP domain-containing sensor histidine kinase [Cyanobacteriota bacterium]